mmetsp:Transcript_36497/g.53505  ORF Transcript_36497/g.53505 Transcript_36497/m.53505 type:complete len:322 (+) Transcript_36497:81-1046(+)|eukprot:CAMPEP_0195524090 /NCGR_PEP_ID=MMETSP0794_2-20130614/23748_1 /TAXON_ID=515487 /ORGANISM="Stephanopyxis turris, Strain CCMP 815" /LENGTH=321 /DNA_ID=CAMNT_0040654247 /DNA_START=76 /DNA_END=1041 /DNA_ORIENTATION=-
MFTRYYLDFGVFAIFAGLASSSYCPTFLEELKRRQKWFADDDAPFTEANGAKHTPYITFSDNTATVTVGNGEVEGGVFHPMVASDDPKQVHFVTHITVVDQDGKPVVLETMDPTMPSPASITFDIPSGATTLTAYEFCNLHGLWEGPTVNVPEVKNVAANGVCAGDNPDPGAFDSFHADFMRRQGLDPFESDKPYSEENGKKHTPYITVENGMGKVTVGVEGEMHPMVSYHWITDIYVIDQDENIIAMKSLDPTNVDEASMNFTVPNTATSLTAYEWCNLHGLWKGPSLDLDVNTEDNSAVSFSQFYPFMILATAAVGLAI